MLGEVCYKALLQQPLTDTVAELGLEAKDPRNQRPSCFLQDQGRWELQLRSYNKNVRCQIKIFRTNATCYSLYSMLHFQEYIDEAESFQGCWGRVGVTVPRLLRQTSTRQRVNVFSNEQPSKGPDI